MSEHFDTVIIGAGLSGIGAAVHHKRDCPKRSYLVLEARERLGGTWDLFRYPGIRSDSDMYTLGYDFKPWTAGEAIADGGNILNYIQETAHEYGVMDHIRFNARVKRLNWESAEGFWRISYEGADGTLHEITASFIVSASGYYRYSEGHNPEFKGSESFKGLVVRPQHWPEDLDYSGKKVVVIGSGATAVTLVPAMAQKAAHVTMLQRSPTWIASRPARDKIANFFNKVLPAKLAYKINRRKNIAYSIYTYKLARENPRRVGSFLLKQIRQELGEDFDVKTHFTPSYNPWDQRLCLVPDSDLFKAINAGTASIVTDHIEEFTPDGILLKSGQKIEADIIVSATGLHVVVGGQATVTVDGVEQDLAQSFSYRGLMFSGIPNLVSIFGYTNASWTLRADLISRYTGKLMQHMDKNNLDVVVPTAPADLKPRPWLDFEPGYLQRAADLMPKQGDRNPWQNLQDYKYDKKTLAKLDLTEGGLVFSQINAVPISAKPASAKSTSAKPTSAKPTSAKKRSSNGTV